jgi:4-hydroxy-4-methyl-2-oxoglutarate aldolase
LNDLLEGEKVQTERVEARDLRLVERLDRLYPAVVSDCLDHMGYRHQVMEPHIRPLYPDARLIGYASTIHCIEVDAPPPSPDEYYKGELKAIDALQPGDVIVVSTCRASLWGELLATASALRGVVGIVADAYTRDTLKLIDMRFPTFVAGVSAYDSLGRIDVDKVGVPIECGGVTVHPGDLLLADFDGVVVVPVQVAEETITAAEEKVSGENLVRNKLAEGMPVWEAFRTYGIL